MSDVRPRVQPRVSPVRRQRLAAWLLLAFPVVFVLVLVSTQGFPRMIALDLMEIVTPLAAGIACLLASRKAGDRRVSRFWLLMSLALFLSSAAEATWAWYELVLHVEAPYPSLADVLWLCFYPLAVAAFLQLVPSRGTDRYAAWTMVLDVLLFAVASALVIWQFIVLPRLDLSVGWVVNLTTLGYPVGDVLLLAAVASLALMPSKARVPRGVPWLALGFLVNIEADLAYLLAEAAGTYTTASWIDPLWPLAYALMGFGALAFLSAPAAGEQRAYFQNQPLASWMSRVRTALPYAIVPVVAFVLYAQFISRRAVDPTGSIIAIVGALLLIVLVLVRQLVVIVENTRLQGEVVRLSREREMRAAARAHGLTVQKQQLLLLNEAARVFGLCTTPRQVMRAGMHLAKRGTGCDAAAVWLPAEDSQGRFAACSGLASSDRRELLSALGGTLESEKAQARDGVMLLSPEGKGEASAKTTAAIPLMSRGRSLGALCLVGAQGDQRMLAALSTAQGIAALMAVSLESTRSFEEARRLADRDYVTGLLNHRGMNERIRQEVSRSQRTGRPYSLVMMDLDHFKLFNDTYGHAVGDRILLEVSQIVAGAVRQSDVVARYGGDEFLALLPDVDAGAAVRLVERIREGLVRHSLSMGTGTDLPVAMSYGIASYPGEGRSADEVLAAADANLYHSKTNGGDRITGPDREAQDGFQTGDTFTVLEGLVTTVDHKDHYTRQHSEDVCEYSVALAHELGLSTETQRSLRIAGLLHDVGKIGIPDHILRKPAALTKEEFETVKQHVNLGELIIKEIPNLPEVLSAVSGHHENYDGTGYPRGLRGEEIPLLGRVLAVADAYSAMTTDRPYRKALTREEAIRELLRVAGSQHDARVSQAFVDMLERESETDAAIDDYRLAGAS